MKTEKGRIYRPKITLIGRTKYDMMMMMKCTKYHRGEYDGILYSPELSLFRFTLIAMINFYGHIQNYTNGFYRRLSEIFKQKYTLMEI